MTVDVGMASCDGEASSTRYGDGPTAITFYSFRLSCDGEASSTCYGDRPTARDVASRNWVIANMIIPAEQDSSAQLRRSGETMAKTQENERAQNNNGTEP